MSNYPPNFNAEALNRITYVHITPYDDERAQAEKLRNECTALVARLQTFIADMSLSDKARASLNGSLSDVAGISSDLMNEVVAYIEEHIENYEPNPKGY